jgi:hypothetical protein
MNLTRLFERRQTDAFWLRCGNSDTKTRSKIIKNCLFQQAPFSRGGRHPIAFTFAHRTAGRRETELTPPRPASRKLHSEVAPELQTSKMRFAATPIHPPFLRREGDVGVVQSSRDRVFELNALRIHGPGTGGCRAHYELAADSIQMSTLCLKAEMRRPRGSSRPCPWRNVRVVFRNA